MRLLLLAALLMVPSLPLQAQDSPLVRLETAEDGREWQAVGRLNLGRRGFCTGTLIAPDLVLTAAHCLFDKVSGAPIDVETIEFLAGWRNGGAMAYRKVGRAVVHPDYVSAGIESADRVVYDLALLQLERPILLPSIKPFEIDKHPIVGDAVTVVSYAQGRDDAPSLQDICHVLDRNTKVLVFNCLVDFGSSGAPIFAERDNVERIVSVVSAKSDIDGEQVTLGTELQGPLAVLRAKLAAETVNTQTTGAKVRVLSGGSANGAKFIRPPKPQP